MLLLRHQQLVARASLSESTPLDVDTIAIPKPLSTRGTSVAFA